MLRNTLSINFPSLLKSIRKLRKFTKTYSFTVFIFIFGFTILVYPAIFRIYQRFSFRLYLRNKLENNHPLNSGPIRIAAQLLSPEEITGDFPQKILIPSLNINLKVDPARIVGGLWEIHQHSANFGLGSALPGEIGNSVVFAHAWTNLFGPLRYAQKGQIVTLETKSGKLISYVIVEKKEVEPSQVEVISPTKDKTLTLFTCSGLADSRRLIVTAKTIN